MFSTHAGLLSLVRDIDPDKFKNNVLALADLAKYFKLPTILTTRAFADLDESKGIERSRCRGVRGKVA